MHPALTLSETRVVKKLNPDPSGAEKLARQFGADLVCVRYRLDRGAGRRHTTVEIVVDAGPMAEDNRLPASRLVRIAFKETELRQAAVQRGATWDAHQHRAWRLSKDAVKRLQLHARIPSKQP